MTAYTIRDAVDPRFLPDINRKPSSAGKNIPIELQPTRRAAARQAALGHGYVGGCAGLREGLPVDLI